MMSKKQWTVLLCLFLIYLLMGAGIFYHIESVEEHLRHAEQYFEKIQIYELLHRHYKPSDEVSQKELLEKITIYCGRPIDNSTEMSPPLWDFYHSFFFAFTVVSTIGYGNLAPTTMISRILMVFYAVIGIPINGILLATLGDFFGKTFIKVHKKWKTYKQKDEYSPWKLGLVGQISMYLFPGFLFFVFMPAYVIMYFEDWDYDVAVYYAFVTLTTIGFGDYVAGVKESAKHNEWFVLYQIFLIVWIVFGLGYLVMVLGFITRGMRSKQIARLEHKLASNIKSTQSKIWNGFTRDVGILRRVVNEIYMLRYKPVYRDEFNYTPTLRERSSSCPELLIYREETPPPKRRRAYSESIHSFDRDMGRVQSDTDLERIDRKATFASSALMEPCELLAQVVSALGNYHSEMEINEGVHGFSDSEILASEKWRESGWTIGGDQIRQRSFSQYTLPDDNPPRNQEWTWSGPLASKQIQEIRKKAKQKLTEVASKPRSMVAKIKKPFLRPRGSSEISDMTPEQYLTMTSDGRLQNNPYSTHTGVTNFYENAQSMLEETTVGDLLRAITNLNTQITQHQTTPPRRKLGTASLTPPKLPSLLTLFPPSIPRRGSLRPAPSGSRRMSLRPPTSVGNSARQSRRFSVRPVELPQYQVVNEREVSALRIPAVERVRSHSLYPSTQNSMRSTSRWRPDVVRNNDYGGRLFRTRHDSLTNIRTDKT